MPLANLPSRVASHQFLSIGAVGLVYRINDRIVLKYSWETKVSAFTHELQILELLGKHRPCPDIVQSFLCVPNGTYKRKSRPTNAVK